MATGAQEPTMAEARLLANLELTLSVGDPADESRLNDLDADDPLNAAMTLNFGGRDVAGVKQLEGRTYARVGAEAVVEDVYGGDEAAVARAERFQEDAANLPDALATASLALRGEWVEVEPFAFASYAETLAEHGGVPADTATAAAGALADASALLDQAAVWESVGRAESTLRSSASLHPAGEERGAELIDVRMPARDAHRAVGPLLALLDDQSARFGIPSLVHAPAAPDAEVTSRLSIRNGVLSNASVDLAQFAPDAVPPLPLTLSLAGGSALNLTPPETPATPLTTDDLSVALLYLNEQNESRAEDPTRADVPGPMQP
ncbi:hypothetical protein [Streptomyces sp. PT12]|uniref:hypothetical protein n=1 Tax=Streptomyces sp. PT12 TaxID=1510197 RepID=UPI000DE4E4D7|nr:hypothetical protein [Streptomyces sp. PT12]RBM23595.1 hypothetical protein DEH69_02500 [Streptomyces sp. PT12]